MKKAFVLLFFLPALLMAQSVTKTGGMYSIDFGKKKKQTDTTSIKTQDDDEDDSVPKRKKVKTPAVHKPPVHAASDYDYRRDGIFKGLLIAGLNACQIDGDAEWGYKYFGAEAGLGAMARFHKFFSVSMEIDYTMKGARARLPSTSDQLEKYNVQWDYVAAPVSLNAHFFKDHLTISAGLSPGVMVRYKEFNYDGFNVTGHSPYGQPHRFDLCALAGIQYTFKKHYAFGFKYSYSTISIRPSLPGRENGWIDGQYNNVLTFRFVYILGPLRKK